MFDSKDTANEFLRYLNSRHNSIKFTIEFKQDNEIPFLDILVKRCPDNSFMTSVYWKKTFTGLHIKLDSFTPRKYKINLIRTLTYRCFRICSSASLLHSAIQDLRKLLLQNGYPQGISSIAGVKQIPLWVHLNFSPLQETSSQGPNQTTLTKARVP